MAAGWVVVAAPFGLSEWLDRREISRLFADVDDLRVIDMRGGYDVGVSVVLVAGDTEIELAGVVPESFDGPRGLDVKRVNDLAIYRTHCPDDASERQSWGNSFRTGPNGRMEMARRLQIHSIGDLAKYHDQLKQSVQALPVCAPKILQPGEDYYCAHEPGEFRASKVLRCVGSPSSLGP